MIVLCGKVRHGAVAAVRGAVRAHQATALRAQSGRGRRRPHLTGAAR